jgi:hypothetical protein
MMVSHPSLTATILPTGVMLVKVWLSSVSASSGGHFPHGAASPLTSHQVDT